MKRALLNTGALVAALILAAPGLASAQTSAPIGAQATAAAGMAGANQAVVRVDLTGGSGAQALALPRGKSAIIELPVDARDVLVTNPAVADAVLRSPRRIYVLGLASGQTDAVFFDAMGRRILSLNIRVDQDTGALIQTIRSALPGSQVQVQSLNDSIILSGMVATALDADRAVQVARQFVARPEQVVNLLSVAGKDQVTLKVRIVEVQRTAIKQLGLNTDFVSSNGLQSYGLGRENTYGTQGALLGGGVACGGQRGARTTNYSNSNTTNNSTNSGTSSSSSNSLNQTNTASLNAGTNRTDSVNWGEPSFPELVTMLDINGNLVELPGTSVAAAVRQTTTSAALGSALTQNIASTTGATAGSALSNVLNSVVSTAYSTVTGTDASFCLEAFERVGLVRTLAEPNLSAVSGEAAKFLAGGEFPVPVGQDNDGRVTIEFKPFGVGLGFTPVVLSGGRISLKMSTEVSELTNLGAFSMSTGTNASLVIPALNVRRAETTVELPSGGSMMIAGLLQQTTKQTIDSLPGMTNLPVLGSLFRSRDYLNGETELVVIVTPYIVGPVAPNRMQTPADGLRIASDPETVLLGRLNTPTARNAQTPPAPGASYQGPAGYVIE